MRMRASILALAIVFAVAALPATATGQTSAFELELEGGATWQSYNNVEIPNDGTATRFSLSDLVGGGPWPSGRLYVSWHLSDRRSLRLLVAPFSLTETGTPTTPLRFAGSDYSAGAPAEATYTFNSYRLSYRWRFHAGPRSRAWVGFTGKIRDATIRLAQGATSSKKDDLGFVPLLHVAADWQPRSGWRISLDADGLAGGPGRAVDASLKLGYKLSDEWAIRTGYRTVEGGADVESVYTFAWLHQAVFSVRWRP